jgi:hypothetical protein
VHSFTGGQGLNTGIQDSFNLAWKLALVDQHIASPSLLQTYAEERLPVIASMLAHTTSLLDQSYENKENPGAWSRDGNLLQLDMNYRWSSLIIDEQRNEDVDSDDTDGGLRPAKTIIAGDRAPDASGLVDARGGTFKAPLRLFNIFACNLHTVLIFTDSSKILGPMIETIFSYPEGLIRSVLVTQTEQAQPLHAQHVDCVLVDKEGLARSTYTLQEGCTTVVIRPDGIVGAVVRGAPGLQAYFRGVFGHLG